MYMRDFDVGSSLVSKLTPMAQAGISEVASAPPFRVWGDLKPSALFAGAAVSF